MLAKENLKLQEYLILNYFSNSLFPRCINRCIKHFKYWRNHTEKVNYTRYILNCLFPFLYQKITEWVRLEDITLELVGPTSLLKAYTCTYTNPIKADDYICVTYISIFVSVLRQSEIRFPLIWKFWFFRDKKFIPYSDELKYFNGFGLCMNERVILLISDMQKCSD